MYKQDLVFDKNRRYAINWNQSNLVTSYTGLKKNWKIWLNEISVYT